jgi:hypothetical protein
MSESTIAGTQRCNGGRFQRQTERYVKQMKTSVHYSIVKKQVKNSPLLTNKIFSSFA